MADSEGEPKLDVVPNDAADRKQIKEAVRINGHASHRSRTSSDPDAQDMVIASLRTQIQDLYGQVTDLNNKLVNSYDRVSDLEDDLHVATSSIRASSIKISQLELERSQHISALNDGLLVEKSHVTAELTRLMEKATEEAAQRGQAESARRDIEKDLDDLSATLFGQANSMVADARKAQNMSEEKLAHAERSLKEAEEAVSMMQQQMQQLQADKEAAEKNSQATLALMRKGKWIEKADMGSVTKMTRLLSSHLPYEEFLFFVAHLRSVHLSSQQAPALATLLSLPFLARLHSEDSEPTIRLDLAPSLNWLSRRSVLSAIHNGQLVIEPMSSTTLLQESASSITGGGNGIISCALCGSSIFSTPSEGSSSQGTPSAPQPPTLSQVNSNSVSWPTVLFRKSSQSSNHSQITSYTGQRYPSQVFIFRLASSSSIIASAPPPLPKSSLTLNGPASSQSHTREHTQTGYSPTPSQSTTIYPLCASNWCLARLRATCSLWAFIRSGVVERIWEEEVPIIAPSTIAPVMSEEKPPVHPIRRGLWGMASALSWSDSDKTRKGTVSQPPTPPRKSSRRSSDEAKSEQPKLPPRAKAESIVDEFPKHPTPPPVAPLVPANRSPYSVRVPPPIPDRRRSPSPINSLAPPTIPKRNDSRRVPGAVVPASPTFPPHLPPRPPRRPFSPANVPLPESRPHTPPVPLSPLLSSRVPPTPPPIPRRAAARPPRAPPTDAGTPMSQLSFPEQPRTATPAPQPAPPPATAEALKEEIAVVSQPIATSSEERTPEAQSMPEVASPVVPHRALGHQADPEGTTRDVIAMERLSSIASSTASDEMFDAVSNLSSGDAATLHQELEENAETTAPAAAGSETSDGVVAEQTVSETVDVLERVKAEGEEKAEAVVEEKAGEIAEGKGVEGEMNVNAEAEEAEVKVEETAPLPGVQTRKEEPDVDGLVKEAVAADIVKDATENSKDETSKLKLDTEARADSPDNADKVRETKEVYVGDATWEERTWKDIVRLKEEMFWARVGTLQQQGPC